MTNGKWISDRDRMEIDLLPGTYEGLEIKRFEVKGYELWNLRAELRQGRGTRPGWYTKLVDHNDPDDDGHPRLWMSDTDAEKGDHIPAVAAMGISKAERVLINGLGLGMVLAAALTYDHVKHVDVVEADERVIKLVGPHYQADPRVNIIHADAYEQVKAWPRGTRWDVAWSDIWPEISADNIPGMDMLHKFYRRRTLWHGMWCRKECLALRRELRAYGLYEEVA